MEYYLIVDTIPESFSDEVDKALSEGWELYGDTKAVHTDGGTVEYSQAMILKEE